MEHIVIDDVDAAGRRYQVTRCSYQTGPHSGPVQFGQAFAHHLLRCDLGVTTLDTRSRANRGQLRDAAVAGREALEAGVPIAVIRRRKAGLRDDGSRSS